MAAAGQGAPADEAALHTRGLRIPFKWEVAIYLGIFLLALVMRLWGLGDRAIHHDESLHAYFSWHVFEGNGYNHNPLTHGMMIFHSTAASFFLFGDSDFSARVPEALLGSLLVVIPWLMRPRLGTVGAIAASVMLAFSPAMLYYSRFAREDIYMAFWLLGAVAFIWRFIDDGKEKFLYGAAGMLALAFTTKESTYIFAAIVGVALLAMALNDVGKWIWGRASIKEWGRPGQALVIVAGLSAPLFAAGIGFGLQKLFDLQLVAEDNTPGLQPGSPALDGSERFVAALIVAALVISAWVIGLMAYKRLWTVSFLVFSTLFVLLFSNFFTHPQGIATGIWQSLGYWIAQHDVQRGNQPWYYYFMMSSVYEFLPWLISIGTVFYYALRKPGLFLVLLVAWAVFAAVVAVVFGTVSPHWIIASALLLAAVPFMPADRFVRFLVFWSGATFLAFTVAGEKMPWLMVNVSLPLIVLAARSINDMVNAVEWRKVMRYRAWLIVPVSLVAFLFIYRLTLYRLAGGGGWTEFWKLWLYVAGIGISLFGLYLLAKRTTWRGALSMVGLVFVGLLFTFSVRTAVVTAYVNADTPRDLLIYTQTSPMLHQLVKDIEKAGALTGEREKIVVAIDTRSGFQWPWAWYLRDYSNIRYADYTSDTVVAPDDARIIIVHRDSNARVAPLLAEKYTPGRQFPHRWWFDEYASYRDLTAGEFWHSVITLADWKKSIDFFIYRFQPDKIGSEDAFVYFRKDLPVLGFE